MDSNRKANGDFYRYPPSHYKHNVQFHLKVDCASMSNLFVILYKGLPFDLYSRDGSVKSCRYVIPGLDLKLLDSALERDDLVRGISEGPGLAGGRRAMGDHWAVEEIR